MTIQPGAMVYTQSFGSRPLNVEEPTIQVRAPATTDVSFPLGKRWINTVGNASYDLTSFTASAGAITANWTQTGTALGALNTLTTGDTNVVTPTAGNITFINTVNGIGTTSSGSTISINLSTTLVAPGSLTTTTTLASGMSLTVGTTLTATGGLTTLAALTQAGTALVNTTGNANTTIGNAAGSGAITLNTPSGNFSLTGNGNTVGIANDAAANTVTLGSTNTTSTTTIQSGTGGLALNAGGAVSMTPVIATTNATPLTLNGRVTQATFTGFTTASGSSQVFVLSNSVITGTTQALQITADNLGSNDAQMTVTRILQAAGQVSVTLKNNGAAALNGNVHINMWVLN